MCGALEGVIHLGNRHIFRQEAETKVASFTQPAIPPLLFFRRSCSILGTVSGTWDTRVNKQNNVFSYTMLRWSPPHRRLRRLQGGVKPILLPYGFPTTSPRYGTETPGSYILIHISDYSDAQSESAR